MDQDASQYTRMSLPESLIDRDMFRACMRQVPGTVSVITTLHQGTRHGLTATAVCSVSADPPQLLVCVNRSASAHPFITVAGRFGVNILSHDQQHVADAFSSVMDDRFEAGEWGQLSSGVPILNAAAAAFDCAVVQRIEAGTHTIFVGAIVAAAVRETPNLIYKSGAYGAI